MMESAEGWAAYGAFLIRDGQAVGSLANPELATWVAEACETLAEMEKAQTEWKASGEAPNCAVVNIGGEEMRFQRGLEMPEPLRKAMGDVVSTVRRSMAEAKAAERAEAKVTRVRALHTESGCGFCSADPDGCGLCDGTPWCSHCGKSWPCPTIATLDLPGREC